MDMLKVPSFLLHVLVALLSLQLFRHNSAATTLTFPNKTYVNYIKTSCNLTTYRKLCFRSLSVFADQIKTNPKVLARTALNVSLAATKTTSKVLNSLSKTQQGMSPRDSAALRDCVELTDDSSYELQRSLGEIRRLRSENFAFGISNIQTWASAALTNTVTCMDGFEEKANIDGDGDDHVKNIVLRRERKVCRLTSNSLALVNSYASGQG